MVEPVNSPPGLPDGRRIEATPLSDPAAKLAVWAALDAVWAAFNLSDRFCHAYAHPLG
jgi:hypothetical protein